MAENFSYPFSSCFSWQPMENLISSKFEFIIYVILIIILFSISSMYAVLPTVIEITVETPDDLQVTLKV